MIMEIRNYVSVIPPFDIVKAVKFNGDVHELAQILPSFELLSAMDDVMMARINGDTLVCLITIISFLVKKLLTQSMKKRLPYYTSRQIRR